MNPLTGPDARPAPRNPGSPRERDLAPRRHRHCYGLSTMSQLYRLRTPSTGREILLAAEDGKDYHDRETGEALEIVGKVLPAAPSQSSLPWSVENLRFCNWCDQLAQRDLSECPTCGRELAALPA